MCLLEVPDSEAVTTRQFSRDSGSLTSTHCLRGGYIERSRYRWLRKSADERGVRLQLQHGCSTLLLSARARNSASGNLKSRSSCRVFGHLDWSGSSLAMLSTGIEDVTPKRKGAKRDHLPSMIQPSRCIAHVSPNHIARGSGNSRV